MTRAAPAMAALTLVALAAASIAGCENGPALVGSGTVVRRAFDVADFDELVVESAFVADVRVGTEFAVEVEADDNVIDLVEVEVDGARLRVGLKPHRSLRDVTLDVRVVAPDLSRVEGSGAVRLRLFDFTSRVDRAIHLSGASRADGVVNAAELELSLSGASRAVLSGEVATLDLSASGASEVGAEELEAESATVVLSGASSATVSVTGRLERVELSGASSLRYLGEPEVGAVSVTGASVLNRGAAPR